MCWTRGVNGRERVNEERTLIVVNKGTIVFVCTSQKYCPLSYTSGFLHYESRCSAIAFPTLSYKNGPVISLDLLRNI